MAKKLTPDQQDCLDEFKSETGLNIISMPEFESGEIAWDELWQNNMNSFWAIWCNIQSLDDKACGLTL